MKDAVNGLVGVFSSRINLVPIEEMASLLRIRKKVATISPGSWVGLKRGKYAGDLAQVLGLMENGGRRGSQVHSSDRLESQRGFRAKQAQEGSDPPRISASTTLFQRRGRRKSVQTQGCAETWSFSDVRLRWRDLQQRFHRKGRQIFSDGYRERQFTLDEIAKFTAGDKEFNDGNENC